MGLVAIYHDPEAEPDEWRVEEIDSDGDGRPDEAIFIGPHAEQRARRFADRLQTHLD